MGKIHDDIRAYVRSSKAHGLFDTIMFSDDPVWAEDELINDIAAIAARKETSGRAAS